MNMANGTKEAQTQDRIFAGRVLTAMASRVSAELGTFSSWMVAGFAAVLGLLVANLEAISRFITPDALGIAITFFLVAVVLHVFQRYMAAIVNASVALGKEVEAFPVHANLDIVFFSQQIEQATLWPMRFMVRWSNARILAGDLAVAGRLNAWLAQAQAWLVFFQLVAVVASASVIAMALQG
jgi:hypothetical protein